MQSFNSPKCRSIKRRQLLVTGSLVTGSQLLGALVGSVLLPGRTLAADALPGSYGKVSPYLVRLGMLQRLPSITQEQFLDHWRKVHAPLYRGTPGLVRYSLNIADPRQSQKFPYDGAEEFWFDSEQALRAAFDTQGNPQPKKRAADLAKFAQPGLPSFVSREIIIREPEGPQANLTKRIGLLQLPANYSLDKFAEEWRDEHAPNVNKMANLKDYRVNIVDPRLSPDCPWAGFASLWWTNENATAATRPVAPPGNGDAFAPVMALVGEEIVII